MDHRQLQVGGRGCRQAAAPSPRGRRWPAPPGRAGCRGRRTAAGSSSGPATISRRVELPDRDGQRVHGHQDGGLDEGGDHHVAAGAHPAERRAGVQPEQGQRDGPQQQDRDHDEQVVGDRRRVTVVTSGTSAHDHEAEHEQQDGSGGRTTSVVPVGAQRLLGQQLAHVALRLQDAGADAALHAGPDLAHHTHEQRREGQQRPATGAACTTPRRAISSDTTTRTTSSAANEKPRYRWMLPFCTRRAWSPTRCQREQRGGRAGSSTTSSTCWAERDALGQVAPTPRRG